MATRAPDVVFVPSDPPRLGTFAFYGTTGDEELEVVIGRGGSARRRRVRARVAPLMEAVRELIAMSPDDAPSPSQAAWAAAARFGLSLVARGRLVPAMSASGTDTWRVGPLDPDDLMVLRSLAAALPPPAQAIPIGGTRPLRVPATEPLLRACFDAMADAFVGEAAPDRLRDRPFSGGARHDVSGLAEWLDAAGPEIEGGAMLGLRIEPPPTTEEAFVAMLQLRSRADPSLVVDAADLWHTPTSVLGRLGTAADADLLIALRRGSRLWPPLGRALEHATPVMLVLSDDDVADLLGPAAKELAAGGIEVLWPAELAARHTVQLRAVVGSGAPASAAAPTFKLDDLLDVKWELTVGGLALTAEELDALAEAKRPLVRMRDGWIVATPELLERLRTPPPRLSAVEALGAALAGTIAIDDEPTDVRPTGLLADLTARVSASPRELAEPDGFTGNLRGYQRRGVAWLAEMTRLGLGGILADEMGLGKTITVIALHLHRAGGPLLVICPASLLGNWERELHRFAPAIPVRRYHGGGRHLDDVGDNEVVLATYGIARRDREPLAEVAWDLVVADEAQNAKNPMARTAKALRAIPSVARVALTGTPVENRLSELWAILDWTTPGLLGPLEAFRRQIAIPIERYRDPLTTERLTSIVRPFILRRRKADPDVAPELPAKTETDLVVPMSPEQVTLYEAVVRETLAEVAAAEGIARRGLVLKLLTALKQICNHPAHYLRQPGPLPGRSGKLDGFDELVEAIVAGGESVLVFSQYVAMARLLEAHLHSTGIETAFLHGGVPAARRDNLVARFQGGAVPVFLLSLRAGGVGLNLTAASHVIHYDRWWNPAVEDQATDRAHRIGQDKPVQVHRLVSEGTVEDRIAELIASKRDLAEAIVGAGEAWISELSDDELADLVALREQ